MGKPRKKMSLEAEETLKRIPSNQREKLRLKFKHRTGRDEAVAELRRLGAKLTVISEITGLHRSSVSRILAKSGDVQKVDWDALYNSLTDLNTIMEANFRAVRVVMHGVINAVAAARQSS